MCNFLFSNNCKSDIIYFPVECFYLSLLFSTEFREERKRRSFFEDKNVFVFFKIITDYLHWSNRCRIHFFIIHFLNLFTLLWFMSHTIFLLDLFIFIDQVVYFLLDSNTRDIFCTLIYHWIESTYIFFVFRYKAVWRTPSFISKSVNHYLYHRFSSFVD